jgi:hypothetical protein
MPENYDIPPIISLHRYFCAVARMQKEYERVLQSPEHEEKRKTLKPDMFAIYLHSVLGPMREPDFVQWVRDLTEAFRVRIEKELAQAPWVENSQNRKNRTPVRREIDKE